MSPSFMEKMFDPFEREKNSTLSGVQGTGLGLPIVKRFVELMEGTIEAISTEGVGIYYKNRLSAGEQGTFGNNEQTINSIRETADHAC